MALCAHCHKFLDPGKMACRSCGRYTASETGAIGTVSRSKTTTLDQVEAVSVERIETGLEAVDSAWGGGVVPSSITLVGGGPGLGKALNLQAFLPTPSGWTTMGDISPGDVVLDAQGAPTRVIGASRIMCGHRCYELEFSDGEKIVADADHLWLTMTDQVSIESLRTTRQIVETLRANHSVGPRPGADTRRYIVDAPEVPSVPVRCIAVDSPSHLYLVGRRMIPTHNTTLLLQLSSIFADRTGKTSYYLSAEQAPGEIRLTAERLEIQNKDRIRVVKEFGHGGDVEEELIKEDPPGMFVVDSISALCGKDKDAALAIAKRYKSYAAKHKAPAFLICHMTKEHDYAGLMALQHEVDTLVTLFRPDEDVYLAMIRAGHPRALLNESRELKAWKNRYGPTAQEYYLTMTAHGMVGLPPLPEKGKKKKSAREEPVAVREVAREIIGLPGFEPPPWPIPVRDRVKRGRA